MKHADFNPVCSGRADLGVHLAGDQTSVNPGTANPIGFLPVLPGIVDPAGLLPPYPKTVELFLTRTRVYDAAGIHLVRTQLLR